METVLLSKLEMRKNYKYPLMLWVLLTSLLPALITLVFIYTMSYDEFLQRIESTHNDHNPYNYAFRWFSLLYNFFLPPYMAIMVICFFEIERKANSWKYISSLPFQFHNFIYAKFIAVILAFAMSICFAVLSLPAICNILKIMKPDWSFSSYPSMKMVNLTEILGLLFINSLGALSVLFLLILIYDNPGVIIIISIAARFVPGVWNPFNAHLTAFNHYWSAGAERFSIGHQTYISIIVFVMALAAIYYFRKQLKRITNQ